MTRIALAMLAGLLAILPFFAGDFYVNLASQILIAAIFALSLNLLVGFGGMTSLGHASFLGVAAYLALTGAQIDFFGKRPIDVLRWAAGITLMWASIEKWAYPEWSYPLFITHPDMGFGFSAEFFMRAAGAVEFALAFALIWTPLVRRVGATILAAMFISAVGEFGKIDLIGHSLIIVALFGIISDNGGQPSRLRDSWLIPVGYPVALALFLAVYYGAHAEMFGTTIL